MRERRERSAPFAAHVCVREGCHSAEAPAVYMYLVGVTPLDSRFPAYQIHKRYSEFSRLRSELLRSRPRSSYPPLPRKYMVSSALGSKLSPALLETRRVGLEHFLRAVVAAIAPAESEVSEVRSQS